MLLLAVRGSVPRGVCLDPHLRYKCASPRLRAELPEYEHTAKGVNFFARLRTTAVTIEQMGIGPMYSSREAIETIVLHCKDETGQPWFQGADALIVQGIGLRDASGNITEFGRLLVNVLQGARQALEG
jgi:hypothetical protein